MSHDLPPVTVEVLIELSRRRQYTIATAESLTGGALAAALVDVPGASSVFLGGIVSYATEVKHSLVGVDKGLLDEFGPIDSRVAEQMADRVRARVCGPDGPADLGIATTGVAGPMPQDNHPVGEVFVAVSMRGRQRSRGLSLAGSRAEIRRQTVAAAIRLAADVLEQDGQ